jgi:ABC-type xylose transport system permease subunit
MAQTKRKRRSKHRGTAAGMIEARGRTGRPPTPDERKKTTRQQARKERLAKAPTWQGAVKRAALVSLVLFVALAFLHPKKGGGNPVLVAAIMSIGALGLYIPSGYYLDRFIYRRTMAKRAARRAAPK